MSLRGVPPEKAAEIFNRQREALERIRQQIEGGQIKTFKDYLDAARAVFNSQREELRAASATTTLPAR